MKELYTIQEAADILRIHKNTVYLMIQEGRLKSIRVGPQGGKVLVPRQALDQYLGKAE